MAAVDMDEDLVSNETFDSEDESPVEVPGRRQTRNAKKRRYKYPMDLRFIRHRYEVLTSCMKRLGWTENVNLNSQANVYWSDRAIDEAFVKGLSTQQKVNKFPGMRGLGSKCEMVRHLNRMRNLFPAEYDFYPRSWNLPEDYPAFAAYAKKRANADMTYIFKPDLGSQGDGILMTQNYQRLEKPKRPGIVQEYVAKPLLTGAGLKFDLRVYVLITSVEPLSLFVHREGMGRFATKEYEAPTASNMAQTFMHLTNYSLNKLSKDFIDEDAEDAAEGDAGNGSKRLMSAVFDELRAEGRDIDGAWARIEELIHRTVLSVLPDVAMAYRGCFPDYNDGYNCFQILGFDILLDEDMKPWLLEVNENPSIQTDLQVDWDIKEPLLMDTLRMLRVRSYDKQVVGNVAAKAKARPGARPVGGAGAAARAPAAAAAAAAPVVAARTDDPAVWQARMQYEDAHLGNYHRIDLPDDGINIFNNERLVRLFLYSCGVRARTEAMPMTSSRFRKAMAALGVVDDRGAAAVDLLFIQLLRDQAASAKKMSYMQFCDGLTRIASEGRPELPVGDAVQHFLNARL